MLARHAEVEQETQPRVDILLQLADTYETQIGDAAQAMVAYQRALDNDERCIDAINALERLYRRTQAWDRLVEVLSKKSQVVDDTELAVRLRLQVGELWEDRLGDNERAVDAYKEVLAVDPQNLPALQGARRPIREDGAQGGVPREPRAPAGGLAARRTTASSIYQSMAAIWEEQFGKPDRAAEALEKILLIDDRNQKAYRDLERLYQQERKWEALVDTYRKHIMAIDDAERAHRALLADGAGLRDRSCAISIAPSRPTRTCSPSTPTTSRRCAGLARLYEETEQWDRAVEMMRRLHPRQHRPASRRSTSTTASARSSTSR